MQIYKCRCTFLSRQVATYAYAQLDLHARARPSLHLACANSGVSDRMDVIVTGRYSVCHLTAKDYLNNVAANIRFISISCKEFMAS